MDIQMDQMRSSICVAPLRITKSPANGLSTNGAMHLEDDPSTIPLPTGSPGSQASEGKTLSLTQELAMGDMSAERRTFHHYLRAFYPFQSSNALSPSTVTLELKAGDRMCPSLAAVSAVANST